MDKRPIGYQPGKPSILDVKVHKTNKYDHVESKLAGKIGTTVKDVEFISTPSSTQATRKPPRRKASSSEGSNPPPFGNSSTKRRRPSPSTTGTSPKRMREVKHQT